MGCDCVVQGQAVMQARHASGAHSSPVWQVQWVDRGPLGEELLMSASADGRITQWTTNQARNPNHVMYMYELYP